MRISDWSSDVCSSDLLVAVRLQDMADAAALLAGHLDVDLAAAPWIDDRRLAAGADQIGEVGEALRLDRKSVVKGKSVSVRVDLGGRRFIKKQSISTSYQTITKYINEITLHITN